MTSAAGWPCLRRRSAIPSRAQALSYVGLATRIVSFTIDAALITVIDVVIGVAAALILSLLHIPHGLSVILAAIAGAAFILGSIAYFVVFWATTGQTPGARVMQIRVLTADGARVKPRWARRALHRRGSGSASAVRRFRVDPVRRPRRGFQDVRGTVVVDAPGPSIADVSRAKKRAIYEASRDARRRRSGLTPAHRPRRPT